MCTSFHGWPSEFPAKKKRPWWVARLKISLSLALRSRRPGRKWVSGLRAKIGNQRGPRITTGKQIGPERGFSPDFLFLGLFSFISYFGTCLFSLWFWDLFRDLFGFLFWPEGPKPIYFVPGRLDRNTCKISIPKGDLISFLGDRNLLKFQSLGSFIAFS